ncbi:putative redox protein, regulator of disulfide bond formation [Beggiatoa alba B18LD]|uniref:Putative redox protein, regulator of disulfide bond formation n=1 Tax=Beggiatoa alba B18LD TaxID=395493 RepID=I3CCQ7_9GAMM|nr:OsmC family protein [Beggiatoa alba]EIJ41400.1 putative redox protein, regulator of disulfide bond formation [Beggiatoa alba B18LD]
MSEHQATIEWRNVAASFSADNFSRDHTVTFPSGIQINASSAPEFNGNTAYTNPEELLVAALSNCHMLTFLAVAAKRGYQLAHYLDQAVGVLEKNTEGKMAVTRVTLNPKVTFLGDNQPTAEQLEKLHESAHRNCFIGNSVKTEVIIAL